MISKHSGVATRLKINNQFLSVFTARQIRYLALAASQVGKRFHSSQCCIMRQLNLFYENSTVWSILGSQSLQQLLETLALKLKKP